MAKGTRFVACRGRCWRLQKAFGAGAVLRRPSHIFSMSWLVASPPIERRHTRQRISEERRRKALLLSRRLPAITISQCQRTGPHARRERKRENVTQDFGHCGLARKASPCRNPTRRQ